jgi:phytoene/squalene synthetase
VGDYPAQLAAWGRHGPRLCRLQIGRVRRLYEESSAGILMLNPEERLTIAAASDLHSGIPYVIERNDQDVFSRLALLSGFDKLSRILTQFASAQLSC